MTLVSSTMLRASVLSVCIAVFLCPSLAEQAWKVSDFPNPTTVDGIAACGRGMKSWICDPDHVLSKSGANVAEGVIKMIAVGEPPYARIQCGEEGYAGYEIGVAVLRSMYEPPGMDSAMAAEQFAQELHRQWSVGRAACQNGVLVLLAMENRQLYISTGEGTKARLTFDQLGNIIGQATHSLRDSNVDQAVEGLVINIGLALADKQIEPPPTGGWTGFLVVTGVVGGIAALVWKGIANAKKENDRYRDCRVLLERIKRDQASLQAGAYSVSSCPICLEEFAAEPGGVGGDDDASPTAPPIPPSDRESSPLLGTEAGPSVPPLRPDSPRSAAAAAASARMTAGIIPPAVPGAAAVPAGASAVPIPPRRALVVQCGHVFCEPCLEQWMSTQRKLSCPICRRDMDSGDEPPPPPRPHGPTDHGDCNENLNAWEHEFPVAVLPGIVPAPRLRLDTAGWHRTRTGSWRYRGANGYTANDWQRHYRGSLTQEQIREMQRNELLFRIVALRRRYPEYVTSDMSRTWAYDVYGGRELSADTLRQFQMADPAVRRALERHGASGSSSSFGGGGGGGHSSGGRGGSW